MNFNTNWEIEKYKSPYECDDHWELRRDFLVAHKEKYPEDQLVCLAQVFFNVELLGCKYPDETMQLVAELSEGIADSYREKKRQKLQRTFVKASDAAEARIKGLPGANVCSTISSQKSINVGCKEPSNRQAVAQNIENRKPNNQGVIIQNTNYQYQTPNSQGAVAQNANSQNKDISVLESNVMEPRSTNDRLKDLIILKTSDEHLFENSISIVERTFAKKNFNLKYSFEADWKCKISIDDEVIVDATATSKVTCKKAASEKLLRQLQNMCYTLEEKTKILSDGSTVSKNTVAIKSEPETFESDIGNKMMKLMGWKGGGLGKEEQGRREPIPIQDHVKRSGLGVNLNKKQLMKKLTAKLENYAKMDTNFDLVFSNDFSKEERAKLHLIAQRFDLKTRSYGSGNDRHLVVSKKIVDHRPIVEMLIRCGGENDKYKLIPPLESSKECFN